VPRFRKKPVVIEAISSDEDPSKIIKFLGGEANRNITFSLNNTTKEIRIITLEGTMKVTPGDWIVRGVQGEFYPCKPDIFEETYEPCD
jgi:hypothetical protein